jgi:hypothetical protein
MLAWLAASTAFALPDLQVTRIYSYGGPLGLTVDVKNAGDQASGPFYVDLWLRSPTVPVVGDYGDYYVWHGGLAAGATIRLTLVPERVRPYPQPDPTGWITLAQSWTPGWVDVVVDTDRLVREGHEANNVVSHYMQIGAGYAFCTYLSNGNLDRCTGT